MHIHPSSPTSDLDASLPSEEIAAIKIQAGFRGYRVRKQLHHQTRRTPNGYHQSNRSVQRRQQPMEGQRVNSGAQGGAATSAGNNHNGYATAGPQRRSGAAEATSIEDRCATKIQAGIRGFLVRKHQKIAADAATKIQAGFRGFKARKEAQKLKQK